MRAFVGGLWDLFDLDLPPLALRPRSLGGGGDSLGSLCSRDGLVPRSRSWRGGEGGDYVGPLGLMDWLEHRFLVSRQGRGSLGPLGLSESVGLADPCRLVSPP